MRLRPLFFCFLTCFFIFAINACDDSSSKDTAEHGDTSSEEKETNPNPNCDPMDTFVATNGQLQVDGRDLVNSCGEKVRLKGVSSMWLNWEYNGFAESKKAMKWMIDNWDIKLIRAAMGVEASGGYLQNKGKAVNQVRTIVQNAIDLGIYVIIDWHAHQAQNNTDEAVAFFEEMAENFGEHPNVIYETWNEPLTQNWSTVIKPYHQKVVNAIRAIDPDNIIILGTSQWSQRVDEAAADPVDGTNLMYTVHFYACSHGLELRDLAWNAYFSGLPVFVTEWGATPADGGVEEPIVCTEKADDWFEILDKMNASWAAWKLDNCSESSCLLAVDAKPDGPFDNLQGHGPYVIEKLLEKD